MQWHYDLTKTQHMEGDCRAGKQSYIVADKSVNNLRKWPGLELLPTSASQPTEPTQEEATGAFPQTDECIGASSGDLSFCGIVPDRGSDIMPSTETVLWWTDCVLTGRKQCLLKLLASL